MEQQEKQKPVVKLFNKGISVAVWPQKKDNKTYYQVSIQRKYTKDNQEVVESLHIFPDDILHFAELLHMTYNQLMNYKQEKKRKEQELQKAWEEAQTK